MNRVCSNCGGRIRSPSYKLKGDSDEYCSRMCLGAKHPQFAMTTTEKETEEMKTKKSKKVSDKARNITMLEKLKAKKKRSARVGKHQSTSSLTPQQSTIVLGLIQSENGTMLKQIMETLHVDRTEKAIAAVRSVQKMSPELAIKIHGTGRADRVTA